MRKGTDGNQVVTILSNLGSHGPVHRLSIGNSRYQVRQKLVKILTYSDLVVNANGSLSIDIDHGPPRSLYPEQELKQSGICHRRKAQ
jgi:alpha-amylase